MNEELEQQIPAGTGEMQTEEAISQADGETEKEEWHVDETAISQGEMNNECPTEEAENASDAGLSAENLVEPSPQVATAEGPVPGGEEGDEENTSPTTGVVPPPHEGRVLEERDYYAEWQELAEAHPEVVGKELPEDIYQACMQSELPPLRVYESMMLQKQADQIAALQQEIATLRQNAENTARAPVVAAAEGPANEPEDLFMKGFNSY